VGAGLRAIYFDKFVGLFARLWDHAHRESLRHGEETGFVHAFALEELPGKHGPGRAITRGDSRQYITPLLHDLESENIISYFHVEIPPGALPSDHRVEVTPAQPLTNKRQFLDGFTQQEIDALGEFAAATKRLSSEHVRALGTHRSAEATAEDIRREFRWARDLCRRAVDLLRTTRTCDIDIAQEILEYADEAHRKAVTNRQPYEEGYAILKAELDATECSYAVGAFLPASAIWETPEVEGMKEHALHFFGIANLLFATARAHNGPTLRRPEQVKRAIDVATKACSEARTAVPSDFRTGLPGENAEARCDWLIEQLSQVMNR
jgi:hypothetical protein